MRMCETFNNTKKYIPKNSQVHDKYTLITLISFNAGYHCVELPFVTQPDAETWIECGSLATIQWQHSSAQEMVTIKWFVILK